MAWAAALGEPPVRNCTMSIQAATHTRGEAPAATQASSGSGVEGINLSKSIPLSGLDIRVSWLAPRELGIGLRCQPHGQNAAREETRWQSKRTLPCAERLTSEPGSTRQQKHCACLRTPLETRQKAAATSGSPHALGTPLERKAAAATSAFVTMLARLTNTPPSGPRNYVQSFGGGRLNSHAR